MNVHNTKTRILGTMIAIAGTFGLAVVAHAGDARTADAPKYADVIVRYSDLNLNSVEGAKVLYARLSSAAGRACGQEPDLREINARMRYKACFDHKLEKAVGKVSNPGVQALHAVHKEGSKVG
jgi:UrcA family protein